MIKAVIFDMDGVIVDSEPFYEEQRNTFFEQEKLNVSEELKQSFCGANKRFVFQSLFPHDEKTRNKMIKKFAEYRDSCPINYEALIHPDILSIFQQLKKKGILIGIASSSPKEIIDEVLSYQQLNHCVTYLLSGRDFQMSKPHPEIYETMVKKLNIPKDSILVIEDSLYGIQSAKSAQLTVLALETKNVDQTEANVIIRELEDLLIYI